MRDGTAEGDPNPRPPAANDPLALLKGSVARGGAAVACASGSAAKLIRTPLPLGAVKVPPSLKPSLIAPSIALEIACPEACATIGVASTCSERSFRLSAAAATA